MRDMHPHTLYRELLMADSAWQKELERVYKRNAGDARYDARGEATPELRRLKQKFIALSIEYYKTRENLHGFEG